MNIFITGIAGFIGSSIAKELIKKNFSIYGIDNLFSGNKKNISDKINWKKIDIRKKKILNSIPGKFDIIIHTAAQTSGEKSYKIKSYNDEANIIGSKNVFNFALKSKAKLMINLSSMSVYGPVKKKAIINEGKKLNPISPYGKSKMYAEKILNQLSKKKNLPIINLRLFSVYGPGQNLFELKQGIVSIYLYYLLYKNFFLIKGSLGRVRDLIYIDDVVKAIILIIKRKKFESGTFNISTGKTTSVKKLIGLMQSILKKKMKINLGRSTKGDIQGFGGKISKFSKKYKWKPKINLIKGLSLMINDYKLKKTTL